jgi:nitroimidazol reductase NimA-like FMN-containing flavoprotein (pyridoxamine 5'-phosphate oxidase superfamily)
MSDPVQPVRSRPHIEGYGIPKSKKGMLEWGEISQRIAAAQNYWLVTVTPEARPHAIPIWGVWVDDHFYFGSGPSTRHMRNLKHNTAAVVHLESGDDAVIVEGDVVLISDPDTIRRSAEAGKDKYGMAHDSTGSTEPVFAVRPRTVFAWIGGLGSATRWEFPGT